MAQGNQFQVTLPSNSSREYFPRNRSSDFTTQLAVPLELEGEWEVAIVDIQYPICWKTIQKDMTVGIVPTAYARMREKKDEFDEAIYKTLEPVGFAPSVTFVIPEGTQLDAQPDYTMTDEPHCYERFSLPAGYYKSLGHLCERINFKMTLAYDRLGKTAGRPPRFQYEEDEDVIVGSNPEFPLTIYTDSPLLAQMLGVFSPQPENNLYRIEYFNELRSMFPPELDNFKSMYVYTDIIRYQMIGDVQAPLLGVFPVKGNYRDQVLWTFMPQNYMACCKKHIDTIHVKLCTDTGDPFPIANNGKVIVRLQFRRKNNLV